MSIKSHVKVKSYLHFHPHPPPLHQVLPLDHHHLPRWLFLLPLILPRLPSCPLNFSDMQDENSLKIQQKTG